MFALSVHALISITYSIVSAHLFSRSWARYQRQRQSRWTRTYSLFDPPPLVLLSLEWGWMISILLLIWTSLLLHVVSYVMQLPLAVPV